MRTVYGGNRIQRQVTGIKDDTNLLEEGFEDQSNQETATNTIKDALGEEKEDITQPIARTRQQQVL